MSRGPRRPYDAKDIDLLGLLQANCTLTNRELASKLNISASTCLERVRKLERAGIIRQYIAIIDAARLAPVVEGWAVLTLRERSPTAVASVEAVLRDAEIVIAAYELIGPFDLLVQFVVPKLGAWREFELKLEACATQVECLRTGLVSRALKDPTPLPLSMLLNGR